MRPSHGIRALPVDLSQQLLAMPLTANERQEVAQAMLDVAAGGKLAAFCRNAIENAPQPDWLRGV